MPTPDARPTTPKPTWDDAHGPTGYVTHASWDTLWSPYNQHGQLTTRTVNGRVQWFRRTDQWEPINVE